MEDISLVEYRGERKSYHCGYCGGSSSGKVTHGMPTHMMSVSNYQALIDRGWRRSGKYCYKPLMERTCCPQYTIRCKALEYTLTKSRKKVLNKMKKFLMSESYDDVKKWRDRFSPEGVRQSKTSSGQEGIEEFTIADTTTIASPSADMEQQIEMKKKREVKKGLGPDPTRPLCKKAKHLRLQKTREKLSHSGTLATPNNSTKNMQPETKSFRDQIPHLNPDPRFKKHLEIRMVRAKVGDSNFEATRKESHTVYQKYQQVIHGDDPYDCPEKQWVRFLVDSSLNPNPDGPGPGYGNYHQQYVLDGKIIAVGVVDVLPNCLSSVYLYYDPDFGFLSLGIYSALSEIAYTQTLHGESDLLRHYYMGFYIHSCQKMKYKGEYPPSELLCPESYEWVPLELCRPALDRTKYTRLNCLHGGSQDAIDPHKVDNFDLSDIGILYQQGLMKYDLYKSVKYFALNVDEDASEAEKRLANQQKQELEDEQDELEEYIFVVGQLCAKRMFLVRE